MEMCSFSICLLCKYDAVATAAVFHLAFSLCLGWINEVYQMCVDLF